MIISSDIFQHRMKRFYEDMREKVKFYIDDILIIGKGTFEENLQDVLEVINRLKLKGMQIRAEKCEWAKSTVHYLGFKLSKDGVEPFPSKVRALLAVKPPKNEKQVRQFFGGINYYRRMLRKRAHYLAPLTELTKKGVKFNWTEECQTSFEKLKSTLAEATMLRFLDFCRPFHVRTDASDYQLGGIVT